MTALCDMRLQTGPSANPNLSDEQREWLGGGRTCSLPGHHQVSDLNFCHKHYDVLLRSLRHAAMTGGGGRDYWTSDFSHPAEITNEILTGEAERKAEHERRRLAVLDEAEKAVKERLSRIAQGVLA